MSEATVNAEMSIYERKLDVKNDNECKEILKYYFEDLNLKEKINTSNLNEEQKDELKNKMCNIYLLDYVLKSKYNGNYLIPLTPYIPPEKRGLKGGKGGTPVKSHKGGKINMDSIKEFTFNNNSQFGILLRDLFVIDIDDHELALQFESEFGILKGVVSAKTEKGRHYFFKRNKELDDNKITDLANGLNGYPKVDLKTITKNKDDGIYTAGLLKVCPSVGKEWIISPFDKDIIELPDDLTKFIISNYNGNKEIKKKKKQEEKQEEKDDEEKIVKKYYGDGNDENDSDLEDLLNILNIKRCNDYKDWMAVGCALKSLGNEHKDVDKYFNLFDKWSKKSSKYTSDIYSSQWCKWTNYNGYTLGTIRFYAKEDNKKLYDRWNKRKYLIGKCLYGGESDIANLYYNLKGDKYMCFLTDSGKVNNWYKFEKHKWNNCAIKSILDSRNELIIFFERKKDELNNNTIDYEDKKKLERLHSLIIKKLKTTSFRENLLKELKSIYAVDNPEEIKDKFNSNPNLLCFTNGVLEVNTGIFRAGKPEDLITFCTNCIYTKKKSNKHRAKLESVLKSIIPDPEILKYVLQVLASCLCGLNEREVIYFWHGINTRNGKGVIALLLKLGFGDYFKEVTIDVFTNLANKEGKCSPELAGTEYKRILLSAEPRPEQKMNVGLMKELAGRNERSVRGLYQNSKPKEAQHKTIIQFNEAPDFSNIEPNFGRKLNVTPFEIEFVESHELDDNNPNLKLRDHGLKKLLADDPEYAEQFMLMLTENYVGFDYVVPDVIKNYTNKFLNEKNDVMMWINEEYDILTEESYNEITKEKRNNVRVPKKDLYMNFISDPSIKKRETKQTFYNCLKRMGIIEKKINGYYYYLLKPKDSFIFDNEN